MELLTLIVILTIVSVLGFIVYFVSKREYLDSTFVDPGYDRRHPYMMPEIEEFSLHKNPVLEYQRNYDKGIHPATLGDPIRIPDISGPAQISEPLDFYGNKAYVNPYSYSSGSIPVEVY